jgi:hypothetical protein
MRNMLIDTSMSGWMAKQVRVHVTDRDWLIDVFECRAGARCHVLGKIDSLCSEVAHCFTFKTKMMMNLLVRRRVCVHIGFNRVCVGSVFVADSKVVKTTNSNREHAFELVRLMSAVAMCAVSRACDRRLARGRTTSRPIVSLNTMHGLANCQKPYTLLTIW